MRVSDLMPAFVPQPPGQPRPGYTYRWARRSAASIDYSEAPRRPADTAATMPAKTSTWAERRWGHRATWADPRRGVR